MGRKFTDKFIAALKPRAQRYEVWEGSGFGVRVSPRRIKSWVWLYRFKDKPRRVTLGTYPAMGLADARLALAKARKRLEQGEDPGAKLVADRKAERQAETVAELAEEYLERWARPNKRSAAEDERVLRKDVLPNWGRRKAKDINRRDVIALLDRIVERGAPIQANRTFAVVHRVFSWAISRDLLTVNPAQGVRRPGREASRDRVLAFDEIERLWSGLDAARMSQSVRLALRFMLATAQRKGEVVRAEWSEIQDGVWVIPQEKAKNRQGHRLPLPPLALSLLDLAKASARGSRWVFPSSRSEMSVTGAAVHHALRANLSKLGLADLTPHDLRRTAASHMTSMGVSRLVVAKILNHVERGVTAVYDRHGYDREKSEALEAWGRRLEEIVAGRGAKRAPNVVRLPVGRAGGA